MRNSNKHVNGQCELNLGIAFRKAVETLLRWHPSHFLASGGCREGKLASVTYSDWLAFYTPLSRDGGAS